MEHDLSNIEQVTLRRLAVKISEEENNNDVEALLEALVSAKRYIVCLRQMIYSSQPGVRRNAEKSSNILASRWCKDETAVQVVLDKHGKEPRCTNEELRQF